MKVGYTPNSEKNHLLTVKKAYSRGADAIQIWVGSPYSSKSKIIENHDSVKKFIDEKNIFLISHSPYTINFARDPETQGVYRDRLINDLINIDNLGGIGTVLHTGKNVKELNQSFKQAEENFTENIRKVLEVFDGKSQILLENMCGSGTSMWCDLDSWSEYWKDFEFRDKVSWCLDTAHLYAAGEYDLSSRANTMKFYRDFDEKIGWESIKVIHFNGSKVPFGAKNDRHADIGVESSGCIATKGLRQLARIACKNSTPLILETPGVIPIEDQIELIRSWVKK